MRFDYRFSRMTAVSYRTKNRWTEEALQALPEDGYLHVVVHGELTMSPENDLIDS
jgi:hypothetical protein